MVHSILGFVLAVGWLWLGLVAIIKYVRTVRRHGVRSGLRRIVLKQFLSPMFLLPLLLMIGLTVVKLSLRFVYPENTGVVVSVLHPDGIRGQPLDSGLHWIVPLAEKVVIYPRYWQTYTMSNRPYEGTVSESDAIVARTLDSQEVIMDISVIFRIDPEQVVEVHRYWQERYKDELLRPSVRAYLRRQVAQYTVTQVNSDKRNVLEDGLNEALKTIAKRNGFIVERTLLRNIAFSPEYARAVEQKQVALEGEVKRLHQAKQIENLARGTASKIEIVAKAEAQAVKIKASANAEARLIQARAEAQALEMISSALKGKQSLLTYRYIDRLSPNVQAVVLPHDMPLIFPLPDMQPPPMAASTISLSE